MTDARGERVVAGPIRFGDILRRYRERAQLSQEELAERAGLSEAGISALERGLRQHPHPATLRRLADALALSDHERGEFVQRPPATKPSVPPPTAPLSVLRFQGRDATASTDERALLARPRHNLPVEVTSFVGRQQVLADLTARLAGAPQVPRLLTLTGPGGCGKTRLALRAAADLQQHYRDGVWLIELASLGDPTLVVTTVATTFGLRGSSDQSLQASLVAYLRPRHILLVLDNCEHLIAACASLAAAILRSCPSVRILATSREPLRIDGETTFRVPSLAVPDDQTIGDLDALTAVESVGLFVECATAAQQGFAVSRQNAPFVAEICRRLDGIPLAIELAAMRVKVLGVEQIAQRLDQRFALLTSGKRAALPRQQTLAAAVAWSYDLLSEPEQRLFEALSVFAGSFSLEAAEAVGGDEGVGVLSLLADLVDKSLVVAEPGADGTTRYRLLETLRQFAAVKVRARGEGARICRRHAEYYAELAQAAYRDLHRAFEFGPYFDRLTLDLANLRVMLRWYEEQGLAEEGFRALWAVGNYWHVCGSRDEGLSWFRRFLAAADPRKTSPVVRAGLLRSAAWYSIRLGDLVTPLSQLREAIDLARQADNAYEIAQGLLVLGWLFLDRTELDEAEATLREGLSAARRGNVRLEVERAYVLLGDLERCRGNLTAARQSYEAALAIETPFFVDWSWRNLAYVALRGGDLAEASAFLQTSLAGYERERNKLGRTECLAALATLAAARGDDNHAAELVGAVENGLKELGGQLYFGDRFEMEATVTTLSERLSSKKLAAALDRGRSKTVDSAIAEALAAIGQPMPASFGD